MASAKFFVGYTDKPASRVLRPPGGNTSHNIFGGYPEETKPKRVIFLLKKTVLLKWIKLESSLPRVKEWVAAVATIHGNDIKLHINIFICNYFIVKY